MASFDRPGNRRRSGREGLGKRAVKALLGLSPRSSSWSAVTRRRSPAMPHSGRGRVRIDRWTVVDLFPGTSHVETVALHSLITGELLSR